MAGYCECFDDCADPCNGQGSCGGDGDCGPGEICSNGCCAVEQCSDRGGCSTDGDCCPDCGCTCDGDCACYPGASCSQQNGDPILIDLSGAGFPLTNAQNGVSFDFQANGKPNQYGWTAKNADVGFLVLDRNGNGKIDNGGELFSNISPQPGSKSTKNGFLALAVYDQPASGGHRDGWITAKDAVYSKLRIWVDKNHDGVSQPSEFLTLAQAGVKAISVNATESKWTDVYGNQFRYKGEIVWQKPVNGRTTAAIYDAILMVQRQHSGNGH